jgi:hypothetical protein
MQESLIDLNKVIIWKLLARVSRRKSRKLQILRLETRNKAFRPLDLTQMPAHGLPVRFPG